MKSISLLLMFFNFCADFIIPFLNMKQKERIWFDLENKQTHKSYWFCDPTNYLTQNQISVLEKPASNLTKWYSTPLKKPSETKTVWNHLKSKIDLHKPASNSIWSWKLELNSTANNKDSRDLDIDLHTCTARQREWKRKKEMTPVTRIKEDPRFWILYFEYELRQPNNNSCDIRIVIQSQLFDNSFSKQEP